MKSRLDPRRIGLALVAPVLALVFAVAIAVVVLVVSGYSPVDTIKQMVDYASQPRTQALIVNTATYYYLSAVAVAIGFKMNLFNIGVDGQYRIATFAAALFAGQAWLPGMLNVIVAMLVAMFVGGFWAGIAGYLKVTRGVSEVISTIMLNAISLGLVGWALRSWGQRPEGSNTRQTTDIPLSSQLEGLPLVPDATNRVYTLVILAVLLGLAYWFVLSRTRFGFDVRAGGPRRSQASSLRTRFCRRISDAAAWRWRSALASTKAAYPPS